MDLHDYVRYDRSNLRRKRPPPSVPVWRANSNQGPPRHRGHGKPPTLTERTLRRLDDVVRTEKTALGPPQSADVDGIPSICIRQRSTRDPPPIFVCAAMSEARALVVSVGRNRFWAVLGGSCRSDRADTGLRGGDFWLSGGDFCVSDSDTNLATDRFRSITDNLTAVVSTTTNRASFDAAVPHGDELLETRGCVS